MDAQEKLHGGVKDEDGVIRQNGRIRLPQGEEITLWIMAAAHQGAEGHLGFEATFKKTKGYIWNGQREDVVHFCRRCLSCVLNKAGSKIPRPLGRLMVPERPFEIISMDFLTFPQADNGLNHVMVILDRFTREVAMTATESCDSFTAASGLSAWMAH